MVLHWQSTPLPPRYRCAEFGSVAIVVSATVLNRVTASWCNGGYSCDFVSRIDIGYWGVGKYKYVEDAPKHN